jgi:hypothetical protein
MGRIRKIQIYVFLQQTRNSTKPNLSSCQPCLTPTFDETLPNLIITFEHARATITTGQRIVSFTNKYNVGLHGYFTGQILT